MIKLKLKVLDLGCGSGQSSVILAKLGHKVDALDISSKAIEIAKKRTKINKVDHSVTFGVSSVESLEFDDNTFDLVFGVGLLHHVNIDTASPEINRVMKPGAKAIFIEPIVFSSILDTIRHLKVVTYFVPDEGAEVLITEDEHQITKEEYRILENNFSKVNYKSFRLISRLDRIISGYPVNENNPVVKLLNLVDRFYSNSFPF